MANSSRGVYNCSFCGRSQDEVQRLIAGPPPIFICDECIAICNQVIAEERQAGHTSSGYVQSTLAGTASSAC